MEYLSYIMENWDQVSVTLLAVMGAAAAIAAWTPTPVDDGAVAFLRKIIDMIGQNYRNAKNDPRIR